MKKIALTTLILGLSTSLAPSLAFAQQPQYTGGMKYTTMRPAQPNDSDKKPVYNRKPTSQEAQNTKNDALPNIDEPTAKPAEQSVWDKYKELAAGKTAKDGDESKPQKPKNEITQNSIDLFHDFNLK